MHRVEMLSDAEALDTIQVWLKDHLEVEEVTPDASIGALPNLSPSLQQCFIADMLNRELHDTSLRDISPQTIGDLMRLMQREGLPHEMPPSRPFPPRPSDN